MRTLLASTLCLLALQTGCSEELTWRAVDQMIAAEFPNVSSISTDSLAERLADDTTPTPLLLDARSPNEYAVSHLRGAHRVDPTADSFPDLDTLSANAPIIVYCSVGYRSAGIVKTLREQGFTHVVNLEGSIFRWANEKRPVYRRDQRVEAVHPYDATWGHLLADSLHALHPPTDSN